MTISGNPLTTATLQKGYPLYRGDSGGAKQKYYVYEVDRTTFRNYIPSQGTPDPQGEEGYVYSSYTTSVSNISSAVILTINYDQSSTVGMNYNVRTPEIGTITRSSSTSISERPIETHPSYSNATFKTYIADNNITSYMLATPTYVYTQVFDARNISFTETLLTSGVNVKGAPTGLGGASATKWIKTGREVEFINNVVTIRDTYSYDSQSWKGVDFGQFTA